MYTPAFNKQDDPDILLAFMQTYNFATLVSQLDGALIATHIPVIIKKHGESFQISGHLAKANPQVNAFGTDMLIIFTGPHAYISPKHYEKYESVPTWNYTAVHAYGIPKSMTFTEDSQAMQHLLQDLIAHHEASYQSHWDSLSEKYQNGMMQGIIGFEMNVTRLEGKYKLSQNRSEAEQETISKALLEHSDPSISTVGKLMQEKLKDSKR